MIEKHTFCSTLNSLKNYCGGLYELEKAINVMFDNNFLVNIIDETISTLTQSFFDTDKIEAHVDTGRLSTVCDDEVFKFNYETIEELLYFFSIDGMFGEDTSILTGVYTISDDNSNTVEAFDATTPGELYEIIIKFLNRNDNRQHHIRCCRPGRVVATPGEEIKNESNLS